MNGPKWLVILRDTVIFALGVAIIAKQAGIFWDPPASVSIELLTVGALMCNIPGVLHVIAWRFGTPIGSSSPPGGSLPSGRRSESLPSTSPGGDG